MLADSAVDGVAARQRRVRLFRRADEGRRGAALRGGADGGARAPAAAGAVLAHMCPIYAVLAAPLARPLGVRVLLWFTHWRASRLLRLAERVSTTVVSVDRALVPAAVAKLVAIGHGIDLADFACVERPRGGATAARSRSVAPRRRRASTTVVARGRRGAGEASLSSTARR